MSLIDRGTSANARFRRDTGDIESARNTVLATGSVLLENSALPSERAIGSGYSPKTQVVLPYFGAFSWRVGTVDRLIDPNAVLFVTGGEEFFETHPVKQRGHGSAIITPSEAVLDEIGVERTIVSAVTRPMSDAVRLSIHAVLFDRSLEPLAREELAIGLLTDTVRKDGRAAGAARAVVERAKEVLHAHAHEVLSLDFVSEAVGVTPIYLTQLFTQTEGVPLYRYQMQLRLSRALLELPVCDNLTDLALDLGFSSHSHFTTKFQSVFGITPSAFRARGRKPSRDDSRH